jgi:hypothetical protein
MNSSTQYPCTESKSPRKNKERSPAFEEIYTFNFNGAHGEDLLEIVYLYRHFIDNGLDPQTGCPLPPHLRLAPPPISHFPPLSSPTLHLSLSRWGAASFRHAKLDGFKQQDIHHVPSACSGDDGENGAQQHDEKESKDNFSCLESTV